MAKYNKKAFTIVELIVAMGLLVLLVGLSSVVFSTTVKAHRKATATIEITHRLNALTSQLNQDFRGLRKDGEIFLVWMASPELDENNAVIDEDGNGIPDNYLKYDRIVFFADGNYQTMKQYDYDSDGDGNYDDGVKTVYGNLARISYMLAQKKDGTRPQVITPWRRRILARVQHIITADAELPPFPEPDDLLLANWDTGAFETANFTTYEYQTLPMSTWTFPTSLFIADPSTTADEWKVKSEILSILTDVKVSISTVGDGGPAVEIGDSTTYHNYFSEGVGDFGIQIWREDLQRWYPQVDLDGDGEYSDGTDYILDGNELSETDLIGELYAGDQSTFNSTFGTALKFTFTLYDSRGIFPDGKTFTHIVYLNN